MSKPEHSPLPPPGPGAPSDASTQRRARLEQALGMPHLKDAKAEAMAKDKPQTPAEQLANNPRMAERYAFDIDWRDARGRRWQGHFVNKVLTIGEHKMVGLLRARQAGNTPVESMMPATVELLHITAWMEVSLIERPTWMENMEMLYDVELLHKVFEEVAAHERTFHGYDKPDTPSAAPGGP